MNRQGDWQEERRLQALALYRKGWRQKDIAEALGVSKGAVSQWMARVRDLPDDQQAQALTAKPGTGRGRPKVNGEQRAQLRTLLSQGAAAQGFVGDFWTVQRVRHLLKKEIGVTLCVGATWNLLKAEGFSCQKPVTRAREQNEKAVAGFRGGWKNLKRGQTTRSELSSS